MAFLRKQRKLISFDEASEILRLSASSIRKRCSGTDKLTHVATGGKRIFLIEDECLELRDEWIRRSIACRVDSTVLRIVGQR